MIDDTPQKASIVEVFNIWSYLMFGFGPDISNLESVCFNISFAGMGIVVFFSAENSLDSVHFESCMGKVPSGLRT